MRSKHLIALIAGIGLLAIALLLAYPALRWSKTYRAAGFADKSLQAYELGNYKSALDHAMTACGLAPQNEEYALIRARAALRYKVRDIFRLWAPILRYEGTTAADLVDLVEMLEDLEQEASINATLPVLLEKDPTNSDGRRLYLRALLRDFQYEAVREVAGQWIEDGSRDWGVHGAYVSALLNFPDPAIQAEGKAHLESLVDDPTRLGLNAIRRLLTMELTPEQTRDLIARVEDHPLAERGDKMVTLAWRYREEGSTTFEDAQREVLALIDFEDPLQRTEYLQWLARLGRHSLVLENLTEKDAVADAALCRLYLNAKIETGAEAEVIDFTIGNKDDLPLSQASLLLIRSRALARLGNQQELEKTLTLAVRVADLRDFAELEREFAQLGRWRNLGDLYRTLMENRATRQFGAGKLIFSHYFLNNEPELVSTLKDLSLDEFRDDANLLNFVAYLKLLYENDTRLEVTQALEDLMAEYPNLYDFRIILALAYKLDGNDRVVNELLPFIPPQLNDAQLRYLRLAHRVIFEAVSKQEGAAFTPAPLEFDDLLPRERAILLQHTH